MADAPSLLTTREVATLLRVRERTIYDMAAAGELPCRRLRGKLLFPRAEIERWAGGGAREAPAVVAGSHDPLLDWAIRESGSGLATFFDGSLSGLSRLAEGEAVAAGLHIIEPAAGEWNVAHVAERLSARPVVVIAWARRRQGLMLRPGASPGARGVRDLLGLRVGRRQEGAGAALLLAHALKEAGLPEDALQMTAQVFRTETDAAAAVASGEADAAPGLEAMARQFGLDFAPLVDERYDLAIDRRAYFEPPLQRLLAFAQDAGFRDKASALGGYDLAEHGEVRWNAA